MTGVLSLGLAGSVDHAVLRALAPRLEAAGFHALWLNDAPGGDALAGLAAVAEVTSTLTLATGVLPFDRRPAHEVVASVERHGLPVDRLVLGVGSGAGSRLGAVAQGIGHLQGALDVAVVLGALGPQMRTLGARMAEGLLLSWLSPEAAAEAAADARQAAEEVGRTYPGIRLYARAAVDPEARGRLEAETATYAGYASYAANFARLNLDPADTTIRPDAVGIGVDGYLEVVDELVLRAISRSGTLDELVRFVEHPELTERLQRTRMPQP
jgi:alkanesulfonate monooxygenase SsuD/methylene tetrahydromethanopterin reductase-like flavin-dependent oxidoreductase (luciferase family)